MCLVISMLLLVIGINLISSGDIMMGTASLLAGLFFISMMIRHFSRVKKERGELQIKDCLSCRTMISTDDSKDSSDDS